MRKGRGRRFDCHSPGRRLSERPPCLTSLRGSCTTISHCPRPLYNITSAFQRSHHLLNPQHHSIVTLLIFRNTFNKPAFCAYNCQHSEVSFAWKTLTSSVIAMRLSGKQVQLLAEFRKEIHKMNPNEDSCQTERTGCTSTTCLHKDTSKTLRSRNSNSNWNHKSTNRTRTRRLKLPNTLITKSF